MIASTLVFLFSLAIALRHGIKNGLVARTPRGIALLALRVFAGIAVLHAVLASLNMPAIMGYAVLLLLVFAVFILVILCSLIVPCLEWGSIAIARLVYEWVYWFPCRDELILKTNPPPEPDREPDPLRGQEGAVLKTLRPAGRILVDGIEHSAVSQGEFIEQGTPVVVLGRAVNGLLVARAGRLDPASDSHLDAGAQSEDTQHHDP